MNTFTFTNGNASFTFEAATYAEALAALVFEVGSEASASAFTFAA